MTPTSLVARTALLVVDLQNDFCHADGAYARAGLDLRGVHAMLPHVVHLIDAAADRDVPVVLTLLEYPRDASGAVLSMGVSGNRPAALAALPDRLAEGSWGARLIDLLLPPEHATFVVKHSYSAFLGTRLDTYLRRLSVTKLVICGLATNGCLLHTVFDAHGLGYEVLLPAEAIATYWPDLESAAITILTSMIGAPVATADVLAFLKDAPPREAETES